MYCGRGGGRRRDARIQLRSVMQLPVLVLAAASMLYPSAASRAETTLSAQATMTLEYNDNLRFSPRSGREDWLRSASVRGVLAIVRPRGSLALSPSVHSRRYENDTVLDNDDYAFDLAAERSFAGSTLQLQGGYHRDAALTSEFSSVGLVEVGVERESWSVQPGWSVELTPSMRMKLGLSYNEVGYEERATALIDYEVRGANWTLARELSEGEEASLTFFASRLEASEISNRVGQVGAQISYGRSLSERLRLSATLGMRRSRFEQASAPRREDHGLLFNLALGGEREYGDWELSASRSVDPSGTGTLVQSDTLSAMTKREWTPSLSTQLRLLVSDVSDLQSIGPGGDRSYGQLRAGVGWDFAPHWTLTLNYRLVGQRFHARDADAVSNAVTLTLVYGSQGAD